MIDGRPKRLIGSWASIIYEAVREGRLIRHVTGIDKIYGKVSRERTDCMDSERRMSYIKGGNYSEVAGKVLLERGEVTGE